MTGRRPPRLVVTAIAALIAVLSGCSRKPPAPTADSSSRRTLANGSVVGYVGDYGNHVWLGIPYAKPPVGALRWRAPQPPSNWTGTREALALGSACTQYGSTLGGVDHAKPGEPVGSEDCLYLNVYAPRFAENAVPSAAARLPVMVWIHGGGNTVGYAGFYNGGNLATTENVIVVALNYRLGPFGWFRFPALTAEDTTAADQSGNYGTLDIVRGLQWVRDNISAFGGDPQKVTVFGESAGGTDVYTMLLSPAANGLFQRAVVESGSLRLTTVAQAENLTDAADPGLPNSSSEAILRLLVNDHRAADRAAAQTLLAQMSPTAIAAYLRSKSNTEILTAYPSSPLGLIDMPKVFRDGTVLPADDPLAHLARADGYNRVPVIVGTNRDENKLFMFGQPDLVYRILWVLPRMRDERQYKLSAEYLAKMWKAVGADEPAAAMRMNNPDVFVYRFDWDEEPTLLGADMSIMLGAAHGFEIPFVFGHFDLGREGNRLFTKENEPGRRALSDQMMSYWAQFAYTGDPGRGRTGNLPVWSAWDGSKATAPRFIVFDTPSDGGVRMSSDAVTSKGIIAAVDADQRLATQRDKCHIFRELAAWAPDFSKAQYASAGKQGCAEFPYDKYPWN